ncbi:MAG: hypothetical protein H0W23_09145, partial [Chloroflexia bacterium]|nr:hypothetical protein [Chloroflexia bacterium]
LRCDEIIGEDPPGGVGERDGLGRHPRQVALDDGAGFIGRSHPIKLTLALLGVGEWRWGHVFLVVDVRRDWARSA